ncbi:MAG: hypothetical protein DMF44_02765 [Verrucomicrobia bacterium]|nr:MAG: hypothetical protein DMF44_02765 [Verrucomicrobiota bacterium]
MSASASLAVLIINQGNPGKFFLRIDILGRRKILRTVYGTFTAKEPMNQPAFVTITLLTAGNIQVGHVASAPTCTEFRLAIP